MYTPEELDRLWIIVNKRMVAACQIGEFKRYIITESWQKARKRIAIMHYQCGMMDLSTYNMIANQR